VKKIRTDEVMKHLMLLKNGSDKVVNASTPRFIASSLSTLNESMLKSPNNNNKKFSDLYYSFCSSIKAVEANS
jgi:hypothetical protein